MEKLKANTIFCGIFSLALQTSFPVFLCSVQDSFYKEAVDSCVLWSLVYFAVLLVWEPNLRPFGAGHNPFRRGPHLLHRLEASAAAEELLDGCLASGLLPAATRKHAGVMRYAN